jgi:hypothetical protein
LTQVKAHTFNTSLLIDIKNLSWLK